MADINKFTTEEKIQFGIGSRTISNVLDLRTIPMTLDTKLNCYRSELTSSSMFSIIQGEEYIVTFNGIEYHAIAQYAVTIDSSQSPHSALALGNLKIPKLGLCNVSSEDDKLPFLYMGGAIGDTTSTQYAWLTNSTQQSGTFSVKRVRNTDIKKIPLYFSNLQNSSYSIKKGTGDASIILNRGLQASGSQSTSQGFGTKATGTDSHAEGAGCESNGMYSHQEGNGCIANGMGSHAEGIRTIAHGNYQHVTGKFNVEDTTNQYAYIIGNGSIRERSNAHTIDWNGNGWYKGTVESASGVLKLGETEVTEDQLKALLALLS